MKKVIEEIYGVEKKLIGHKLKPSGKKQNYRNKAQNKSNSNSAG